MAAAQELALVTGASSGIGAELARQMAAQGTYCNMAAQPNRTLAEKPLNQPLAPPERRQLETLHVRWQSFRRGVELGVPSFFSTDAIYGQWEDECTDLPWLLTLLVERGGLTGADALRMVTAIPAQALGLGEQVGTLAAGRLADLLVVRGNPLARIRDVHQVIAVYKSGRLAHSRPEGIQ